MDVLLAASEPVVVAVWFGDSPIRDGQIGRNGFWPCSKGISGNRPWLEDWPDGESLAERPTRSRRPTQGPSSNRTHQHVPTGCHGIIMQGIIQDAIRQA